MRAARKTSALEEIRPLRVALYLRVSTGRQAEGDVSLPSQRDLTQRHCEREGWNVVDEYVEPGATGTDDRRPAFQTMLDRACDTDHPYDVIVVHSFSRFFRDGATMELTIRKLRRHGVEVVSTTQPTGKDPSQEMMRQIIGIFDEYTSKENSKNVTRSMLENAKQNFWNGATPPLGYKIIDAERRGQKIKKKLAVDPVEQETVQLIYRLYADGDPATDTPPLGIKGVCTWLNGRGYRTKRGGTFGIGPLHLILTNTAYIGRWKYNVRSAKTGEKKPENEIVEIAIPAIIDQSLFDRVQAKLAANNPKVTAPRVVNGPILLTGLATCAHCGGGMMQRTGTSRSGKVYAIPLRKDRENAFGETVRETVGIAAPVVVASGTAKERKAAAEALNDGEMMLTVDDVGGWVFVRPSDSPYDQILLRVEEWAITDKATAEAMVEEMGKREAEKELAEAKKRAAREDLRDACEAEFEEGADSESAWADSDREGFEREEFEGFEGGLSDIPTYPRLGPDGPHHEGEGPPG